MEDFIIEEYLEEFVDDTQSQFDVEMKVKPKKKPKQVKSYQKESLETALNEIRSNIKTVYAASKEYKIPQSTLWNRLKMSEETRILGRKPILNATSEKLLADWALEYAEIGDPRTRQELLIAAKDLSKLNEDKKQTFSTKDGLPTARWLEGFMKRNPNLSFRTPEAVTRASANVSEEDLRRFFDKFVTWLDKNNLSHLKSTPSAWLNSDETGYELNAMPTKVLAEKGSKNIYRVDSAKPKERISVMYTFGADGHCYRPQLIFKKSLSKIPEIAYALGGKTLCKS